MSEVQRQFERVTGQKYGDLSDEQKNVISAFILMEKSKKEEERRKKAEEDDFWLLLKIEVGIFCVWLFLFVGNLMNVRAGDPSASAIMDDDNMYKLFYLIWVVVFFALTHHHYLYHSHNAALRMMNVFRILTCLALLGVAAFDVSTYPTHHFAFVTLAVFFCSISIFCMHVVINPSCFGWFHSEEDEKTDNNSSFRYRQIIPSKV